MSLATLAERSEVPPRTIRLYIARGLLGGPLRRGAKAGYSLEHLNTLRTIRDLQGKGLTLAQIHHVLSGEQGRPLLPEPATWSIYPVSSDLHVMIRGNVRPQRQNQLKNAVRMLMEHLGTVGKEKNHVDPS